MTVSCNGNESYGLGGLSGDTDIRLENTEIKGRVQNDLNRFTLAEKERIFIHDGAIRLDGTSFL